MGLEFTFMGHKLKECLCFLDYIDYEYLNIHISRYENKALFSMTPEVTKFIIGIGLVFIILIGTLFGTFYYNLVQLRNEEKKINWTEVNFKLQRNRKERLI